ncbi:hypothetical protein SLEP1_g57275 [Rubroshorea leprosula]|uniref:Uncharacterized protein n=1 Tax=Rubroshorea leprosula TaxID=152421 RepID=A0AAV5MKR2_9ROSI|nr:hypothetical protein SLEP1_g57275 [Rubroshorea leprosula]
MDIPFFMNSMNLLLLFFSRFSYGTDIITSFENLIDGRTLVSSDGSFELGVFSLEALVGVVTWEFGSGKSQFKGYKQVQPNK